MTAPADALEPEQDPSPEVIDLAGEATSPVVLVVDDDELLSGVVEACLDFEGADVRAAHTLADARQMLADDLSYVVLDRHLPDGDGLELIDELRERCPDVPLVVYSAVDDDAEPEGVTRLPKTDVAALVDLIGLHHEEPAATSV